MNSLPPTSLTLWHGSRFDIPRPTIEGRVAGDNHDNSGLGIYCSTKPKKYVALFGNYVFQLNLRPDVKVKRMTISELADLSRDRDHTREWFEYLGKKLGEQYDIIELEEVGGGIEQAIILRDDAVITAQRHTSNEFVKLTSPKTSSPGPARI